MNFKNNFKSQSTFLETYSRALGIAWTIIIGGLLVLGILQIRDVQREMARNEARANFNKDQALRFWAASHGGVYVPATEDTPPNPYLSHIPERDIKTPSGKSLTLMNPAYILRQTMEKYAELYGVRGHITSLKHLRPETAPDEWEKSALKEFEQGAQEVFEFTLIGGKPYFRMMSPMFVKKGCLKCHGFQGYKVGDVRGGVSVSVPMAPYLANQRRQTAIYTISFGLLWSLGLTGIIIATRGLKHRIRQRDKAETELQKANDELEQRVEKRTHDLGERVKELNCLYGISNLREEPGHSLEEIIKGVADLIPPSWQHSEITCSRIILEGEEYKTKNFKETTWKLTSEIMVHGETIGVVEVFYLVNKPENDEGPFLKEERSLINAIAERLGSIIERKRLEETLRKAHDELERRVEERTSELVIANEQLLREIEEHKKTKEASERLERRFEELVEGIDAIVWEADAQTFQFNFVSKRAETLLKYPVKQWLEYPQFWVDHIHPDDRDEAVSFCQQATKEGKNHEFEYRMIAADGSVVWLRDVVTVETLDGVPICLKGIMVDISRRKLAEEEIRKSKSMLQRVFDGISDPLILLDENLSVKIFNMAASEYYQVEHQDIIDKPCFEAFMGGSSPCVGCNIPSAVLNGQHVSFERKGIKTIDKVEQVVVYPLREKDIKEGSAIIRISDITESRRIQRQLMQSEKLASLGFLISGVAHETNNPNNFITFNLPILRDYLQELIPIIDDYAEEHKDFDLFGMSYPEFRKDIFKLLDNMEHGSRRINTTVNNLMEFYRMKDRLEEDWIDIAQVIEKGASICRGKINRMIKSFEVNIPENLPLIYVDPQILEQVLVNLLINAGQAADKEDSWVRLSIALGNTWKDYLIIDVSDNGCGMDEKTKEKIFDPFYTTKAPGEGTGVGLSLCHNLIEALGGRIEVESEPGIGSTFRVILTNKNRRRMRRM